MHSLFRLLFLLFFLSSTPVYPASPQLPSTFDYVVPLGLRCEATNKLIALNLKGPHYGFEWLISSPRAIADLILSDFKWFLTPSNFLFITRDTAFKKKYLRDHYILDRGYGLVLVHDFSLDTAYDPEARRETFKMYEFPEIKQTFRRRINRFIKTMERAQKNKQSVLFYRDDFSSKADAELLSAALALRYPLLDFTLFGLSENNQIIADGEVAHVINRPRPAEKDDAGWHTVFGTVVDFSHQKVTRSLPPQQRSQVFDLIIPLGDDQRVSDELQAAGIKGEKYGFESCISESPISIAFALLNNLEGFADPDNFLTVTSDPITYKYYGLHEYLLDRRYFLRFTSPRDPLLASGAENQMLIINQIHHLHTTLTIAADKGSSVLFVRKKASKRQTEFLSQTLSRRYPNLNFMLLVVDSTQEVLAPWNLPRVVNRYVPPFTGCKNAAQLAHEAWKKILSEVITFPSQEKPALKRRER